MNRKILIVEDESDFAITLALQAKIRGYKCELDLTGSECIDKAKNFAPEVILLDMNLPHISGLGLIQEIKNHQELSHIPIIILSALNQRDVVDEAMNRGANAYFTKGSNLDDLFNVIKEYSISQGPQAVIS